MMAEAIANEPARIVGLYRTMCVIRTFEEEAAAAFDRGEVIGSVHQTIGQEGVDTGVCSNLRRSDLLWSNHRGHGHSIAKGADPIAMMKELYGRVGGTSGAKGGSMHIADFSVGMLGSNGVLADGLPMACGAGHSILLRGEDKIVTVFVGDGTTNRGPFYEALNWSMIFRLPVLFVCEDNSYASSTRTSAVTAGPGPVARAQAFGMPTVSVDGNDILAVDAAAADFAQRVRSGEGPHFLHARTYRIKGHISRDKMVYRPDGETEENWKREPIGRCEKWLMDCGVAAEELEAIRKDAAALIARAVEEARAAPLPDRAIAWQDVQDHGAPERRRIA
ncbi:MAG: thiamine pyrophosphate-dependent dehydrogenase E1 component subunit alpha [Alphaproteobacteria bacterium]|nr:thiamine pyrophosphate-dependent dehydrogenase E1 component subunit alpha [Alphaproteobacteria bacterium]